jgi:predicted heme/steroid binding protein
MSANSSGPAETGAKRAQGAASTRLRRYTRAELARHDGSDPALPVLVAYEGKVYDVTASFPWAKGVHWGDNHAGRDLTGRMKLSIHDEQMLSRVPCVGELAD